MRLGSTLPLAQDGSPLGEIAWLAAAPSSGAQVCLAIIAHLIYAVLLLFIVGGLIERIGYLFRRPGWQRVQPPAGLPAELPLVCVQLPMFNESAVAVRAIDAACALDWPRERLEVQVLDDSTDASVRAVVDAAAAGWRLAGVKCYVLRRDERTGYKAGALEVGRKQTEAEFLASEFALLAQLRVP